MHIYEMEITQLDCPKINKKSKLFRDMMEDPYYRLILDAVLSIKNSRIYDNSKEENKTIFNFLSKGFPSQMYDDDDEIRDVFYEALYALTKGKWAIGISWRDKYGDYTGYFYGELQPDGIKWEEGD